ncbi:MAG: flagellar motor protein, partial [Pyrinomonadaceae bacterium]|nr:flagellar motor protein [Pyrinomonadaceae bacterium]
PGVLGAGISAAFVATIYGIGSANLVFFPIASRLRARKEKLINRREEIAAVIIALGAKETPRRIINQFNLRQ